MSELKAIESATAVIEKVYLVYRKSEADKVIAEKDAVIAKLKAKLEGAKNETNYWCNNLKVFAQKKDAEIAELKADYQEACDRLQTANLIKDEQLAETRHQKYKRCLKMAKICEDKLGTVVKPGWWNKWYKRWLEIAEKIKEGV